MISRRKLLVAGCVVLAMIASLLVLVSSDTLGYDGKAIDQWLGWFDSPSGLSQEQWQDRLQKRSDAAHALRQIGPDVFPHLRRMLQPDSATTEFLRQLSRQINRKQLPAGSVVPPSREEARMLRAVEACSVLGRDAQAMIPDLVLVVKSNSHLNVRSRAAYALGAIGGAPEVVVPALLQSLSNRTDANVLISLGKYGSDADRAVPNIVALLDGIETSFKQHKPINRNVLSEAVRALYRIAPDTAKKRLPLVREILREERDPLWRSRLGKLANLITGTSENGHGP